MYVNLLVQLTYRVVKLRGLFLHVKALNYDLEFLGVNDGGFWKATKELTAIRNSWFQNPISEKELASRVRELFRSLVNFLDGRLTKTPLYVPDLNRYRIATNLELRNSDQVGYKHSGLILPATLAKLHPKVVNGLNRLNKFEIGVPLSSESQPKVISKRFEVIRRLMRERANHLGYFLPLTSSLHFIEQRS